MDKPRIGSCVYNKGNPKSYYLTDNKGSFIKRSFKPLNKLTFCNVEYFFSEYEKGRKLVIKDFELLKKQGLIGKGFIYLKGSGNVLLTAPHASEPFSDFGVCNLVFNTAKATNCHALISTVSRGFFDYNNKHKHGDRKLRSELKHFDKKINKLKKKGVTILLDIHSMRPREKSIIDLGVAHGTASNTFKSTIQSFFNGKGFNTSINEYWSGGDIIQNNYRNIEALQAEISYHVIKKPYLHKIMIDLVKNL